MAYSKQTWKDEDLGFPVSAARLSHLEDGVAAAHIVADGAAGAVDSLAEVASSGSYNDLADTPTAAYQVLHANNGVTAVRPANVAKVEYRQPNPPAIGGAGQARDGDYWLKTVI